MLMKYLISLIFSLFLWFPIHGGEKLSYSIQQIAKLNQQDIMSNVNLQLYNKKQKEVLLVFWASWCVSCKQDLSHFSKLKAGNANLAMFGVSLDSKVRKAKKMVKRLDLSFPNIWDGEGHYKQLFQISELPHHILLKLDQNKWQAQSLSIEDIDKWVQNKP